MKKIVFLSCLLIVVQISWAKGKKESYPSYQVISDEADESIEAGMYVVEGKIINVSTGNLIKNVRIEVQGKSFVISKNGYFELKIPLASPYVSFNHKSIDETYYENHSPKEKRRIKVIVNGVKSNDRIQVVKEKPVIYAYADKEVSFDLTLDARGKLQFTYPQLQENNTWSMKTNSDGTLKDSDGKVFPYLFWDAKQEAKIQFVEENNEFAASILTRNEVLPFLDSVLDQMAFNAKEKTDFITYWGPRLVQKEYCLLQFQTQDICDQFAAYEVSPKPDNFNRVYLLFTIFDDEEVFLQKSNLKVKPQEFKPFSRSGFNLLEWGGMEFEPAYFIKNL